MPAPSTTRDSLPYIYCGNALLQETGPGKNTKMIACTTRAPPFVSVYDGEIGLTGA